MNFQSYGELHRFIDEQHQLGTSLDDVTSMLAPNARVRWSPQYNHDAKDLLEACDINPGIYDTLSPQLFSILSSPGIISKSFEELESKIYKPGVESRVLLMCMFLLVRKHYGLGVKETSTS